MSDRQQLQALGEAPKAERRQAFKPGPPHPDRHRLAETRRAMDLERHNLSDHLGCFTSEVHAFELGDLTLAITPDEYRDEIARCRLALCEKLQDP